MWKLLFYLIGFTCLAVAPFVIAYYFWRFYFRKFKKVLPIPSGVQPDKQAFLLKRIFVDFPKQLAYDRLTIDPNTFPIYGMHLFCGEQGSGKTTCMAYMIRKYKRMYPQLRVISNFHCSMQDAPLESWRDLTLDTNGIYGEIDCIDEIQNWFASNASRDFPPDMLTVITQQRKVRRCIFATSQVFTRVAKPIRENTYLMYYPFTIAGCLTVVRVYKPVLDEKGDLKERKLRKVFCFVHDNELRSMFDSYKTICTLSQSGFKNLNDQLRTESPLQVHVTSEEVKKK